MISYIPEHLLKALAVIPDDLPSILLLRHAERKPIIDGDSGINVGLTLTGYKQALVLGKKLGARLKWAQSSPLLRARRTIDAIIRGSGISTELRVENNALLGEPGPFVIDTVKGALWFAEIGTKNLIRELIAGRDFDGIRNIKQGVGIFMDHLKAILMSKVGLGLMISHDAILIPILALLFKESFDNKWLQPLDGMLIVANSNKLSFCRNYNTTERVIC